MIGTDKLYDIKRWSTREEVLRKFRIVAFEREGEDAEELVLRDPFLKRFADSFVFLSSPPGVAGVSSTVARERLFAGESCASLLHPEVERLFKAYVEEESARKDEIQKIMQFDGPYDFLSNFYEASIEFEGVTYQTSEAAFQAQKCINPEDRVAFAELSAAKAKRYGRKVPLRPDWEDVKVELMERIVRAKFTQHQELAQRLLATNDLPLVEGNTWFDLFWGVDVGTGRGKNLLGKILMKVRDELVKIEEVKNEV